jgi:radical SAM superfamily enzyme YgiQ (UPF0313 family)
MSKTLVYLADLTHTGQGIASNVFPLGIGLLASYLDEQHPGAFECELFKYPEDLHAALGRRVPQVVGFSNYSWNCHLSMAYAKRIKEASPGTVVIAGGPNYGTRPDEVEAFWRRYPWLDFYVVKEGERAFAALLDLLRADAYDVEALKRREVAPGNCHYAAASGVRQGELLPRVANLDELGSPYLKGMMDRFFDDVLVPMVHTTRGCPFACTFCSEGNTYYNKVAQGTVLERELAYIAQRVGGIHEVMLTDANFGMFNEDRGKAEAFARVQAEYGWPRRITTATGKNRKERVVEVASLLNGALTVAASLQSTNATVLENIKRQNISADALTDIVKMSEHADSTTYTELIVGLPGDTVTTHATSLRDAVDAGLGMVRMYQLILLPQTEMCEPATRRRYGFETRFRINQRCFGEYPFGDGTFASVESEEIVIATSSLPVDDYVRCRELNFTVEIFHNSGMFAELQGVCRWAGISWFDVLERVHARARTDDELAALYAGFRRDTMAGLWASQDALERDALRDVARYVTDTEGTNEMVKGKALAASRYPHALHDVLYDEVKASLERAGLGDPTLRLYLDEIAEYSLHRKQDFLNTDLAFEMSTHFDLDRMNDAKFRIDPQSVLRLTPQRISLRHTDAQKELIRSYVKQFGSSVEGMGRILMRAHSHADRLYRSAHLV